MAEEVLLGQSGDRELQVRAAIAASVLWGITQEDQEFLEWAMEECSRLVRLPEDLEGREMYGWARASELFYSDRRRCPFIWVGILPQLNYVGTAFASKLHFFYGGSYGLEWPPPEPERLTWYFGRCLQVRAWAAQGFPGALEPVK